MPRCILFLFAFVAVLADVLAHAGAARACHVEYVLKENDTLQSIAHQIYNDPGKWQIIYYANQDRLAEHSSLLRPGTAIRLPCVAGVAPQATPQDKLAPKDKLNTGLIARKEPQVIMITFHLTSADGTGRKIGFMHARNTRISIGAREETALILSPYLEGLPPGPHAFHVHSNPNCGPAEENGKAVPGLAAGPHLFLKGTGHEAGTTYLSHLGNLPNLVVAPDGAAKQEIAVPRLTLEDIRGRSIIVHATNDDASARQACGVVPGESTMSGEHHHPKSQ